MIMDECTNHPLSPQETMTTEHDHGLLELQQETPGHTMQTRQHQGTYTQRVAKARPHEADSVQGKGAPVVATTQKRKQIIRGVQKPEKILPQIPMEQEKANFYLWIYGDHDVESATIHFSNEETLVPLFPVPKTTNMWYCRVTFNCNPIKCHLKYKYSFHIRGNSYNVPVFEYFGTKPADMKEICERSVANQVQFDAFHFPDQRHREVEIIPKTVIFYLKWFIQFVEDSTLPDILKCLQIFTSKDCVKVLNKEQVKEMVSWILTQASDDSIKDIQRLYLCRILSYFKFHREKKQPYKETKVFDYLLKSLRTCAYSTVLSKCDCAFLKDIAIFLVENSSRPGWLTLAAYFYPYLGVGCLIDVKSDKSSKLNFTYDCKEYESLLTHLFSHLKVKDQKDQVSHQKLLRRVMNSAPNLVASMKLFERVEMLELFAAEEEKITFFTNILKKEYEKMTNKKKSSQVRLGELYQIPHKILDKMPDLLHSILQHSTSEEELESKDKEIYIKLILSMKDPDVKKLTEALICLSRSKTFSGRDILRQILNDDNFQENWCRIADETKVKICTSLVSSCVKSIDHPDLDSLSRIVAVYQCIDSLMQCCLIQESLILYVHTHVVEAFIKEYTLPVLQAFVHIEKLTPTVQNCYVSHVKQILTSGRMIKESINFLEECSKSKRLGREILLYILDIIHLPTRTMDENDFKTILKWLDVWIILLKGNGMLEDSKKYQDGQTICQQLAECITVGNISPKFTEELYKEKRNVSKLCASIKTKKETEQSFEDKISELMSVVKSFPKKFQGLESAINFGKEILNDVCPPFETDNIENVMETLNKLRINWRTRKVDELRDDKFWEPLLRRLLEPAKALQPLVNSLSFMAVAKKCLKLRNSGEEKYGNTEVNDFYSFMEFTATTAIKEFEADWKFVLKDPGSLTVGKMKSALGTLKNRNQLDEELETLTNYFKADPSNVKIHALNCLLYPSAFEAIRHINDTLELFKLTDLSEKKSCLPEFPTTMENIESLTLERLSEVMAEFNRKITRFSGEGLERVFKELSCSNELVSFMEEIVDDDIRFLIDAVEEHFDQSVCESSVSDLIVVHGFLAPLIKKKNNKTLNLVGFLSILKKFPDRLEDIAGKIKQCNTNVNSLRGLYMSIANRGEMTKVIISNCLSRGEYWVSQEDGICEIKMSYAPEKSDGEKKYFSLTELQDLRSRAHLIATSHKNAIKATSSDSNECSDNYNKDSEIIDFEKFINQVNLLTEISTLLSTLRSTGYVKYRGFQLNIKTTDELKKSRDILQKANQEWEEALEEARKKYYFLNYYRSDQIWIIYDIVTNGSKTDDYDEVLSLFRFVDSTITEQKVKQHQGQKSDSNENPESLLSTVGETLEKIFKCSKPVIRPISNDGKNQSHPSHTKGKVGPEGIFVASLEPGSPLTANVILTLYENTSNAFPEPYQIVFCSSQTTWEEIHLLLQRCFRQPKCLDKNLFCIANVELLSNEIQFRLVSALKKNQNCNQSSEAKENDYYLALICCGGDHHHFVEQFAKCTHHIASMSDSVLEHRLQSGWPEVKMVTSTLPGFGKTETIKSEALEKYRNIATVSISGPFNPSKLIQRLKQLSINEKSHCLHLDIGEVSDPLSLDILLFQLIVTGMVSAGNQFYHLPTTHIYIEIANTLKDQLRQSMVISKNFTRIHLKWQNYDNLSVSSEITSDIQVVCHYLDIFDRACIESEEVHFSGSKTLKPLPNTRCQELLAKHYSSDADISFTTLHTFLGVLADQLSKLSKSAFFKPARINAMIGQETQGVRTNLFEALLNVSKEFASRACRPGDSQKAKELDDSMVSNVRSAEDMTERVARMIKWEDSNHLIVVFHGINSQAITAMYRNKSDVPLSVANLLKSQKVRGSKELEDFNDFTQEQLQNKLEKIVCTKPVEKNNLFPSYALTPDNILKMILIILRVRANVPVIIMGETGCGKTSLVRYLANTCGVKFCTLNFHAGTSEEDIVSFINEKNDSSEQTWIFLDEINTCEHLGVVSEVICHHSLFGQPLSRNLVFLAACNPYKLRTKEHIKTAGLEGKDITDEYSQLVYRVRPLPEAMVDYVWDYGSLGPSDERDYIKRMVRNLPKYKELLVELLSESQKFIRDAEKNHYCVSLRDVYRCIHLISWFEKTRETRENLKKKKDAYPSYVKPYHSFSQEYEKNPMIKSIVLALAHCYLSRLQTAELRRDYRECMMNLFRKKAITITHENNSDAFAAIVRMEEEDYLNRMELPPGTARNTALRENVFVMLVCILNRIPIFVVGKPGCSKSLSIQLIRSNLRGRDSRDSFFRTLPQLYVVSYQGSESSTSEGIVKVFEKAVKYQCHNKDSDVLPVVLLDEVGLAENSKNNPLKVLHSLLEADKGKFPDVAVVGISNWSLDAAKMNRAIHLSRPEPTEEDLFETGRSIKLVNDKQNLGEKELRCLAEAYFEYQAQQSYDHFHGLRDYYSLIKDLTRGDTKKENVNISIQRNFGGLPGEVLNIQKIFLSKLKKFMILGDQNITPVVDLIQANIEDPHARHLMLIGNGDSVIDILKQSLAQLEKEVITIFGSRFEEDLSEDYNYRILSRIILCMERNCILILRDLDSIYGSLYDMLNQNYAVVGNKKNCRVALGAYSNPMCQVNDGFRCIVLIDQHNVPISDPPFLNRFEKQLLRYSDVLTEQQKSFIRELDKWVDGMSKVKGLEKQFNEIDMFIGFHEDTLPSLVLSHNHDTADVVKKCKDDLMWIASPDGVLRTQKCDSSTTDTHEMQELRKEYFKKPLHQGLDVFMKYVMNNEEKSSFFPTDEIGTKTVVMTFTNIHTDIRKCLGNSERCRVERLSAYKSEKQLTDRINEFWNAPTEDLLVLQCNSELDGRHLLHARFIIEKTRNSYKQASSEKHRYRNKHVCIVLHIKREECEDNVSWQFSFLCGWRQVFLDALEAPQVPLIGSVGASVQSFLRSSDWSIRKIAENHLLWCFTCIKYTQSERPLESVLHISKNLFNSAIISQALETLILQSINSSAYPQNQETQLEEYWQVNVACDRQSLVNSSTLYCAIENYVKRLIRNHLAKIVYFLEKENAWPPHLGDGSSETLTPNLKKLWCSCLMNNSIVEISDISEPCGDQSYILESTRLDLRLPFSQVVARKVNSFREQFLDDYSSLMANEENLEDGQLKKTVQQEQIKAFAVKISHLVDCYTSDCHYSYMEDILDLVTAEFNETISRSQRVSIAHIIFISQNKQNLPVNDLAEFVLILHAFLWFHLERIIDLLKMVDCCRSFIDINILTSLTDGLDRNSKKVLLVENKDHSINFSTQVDSGATSDSAIKALNENENESKANETGFHHDAELKNNENKLDETKLDDIEIEFKERLQEKPDDEMYDEGEDHEDSKRLEDILVTAYCERMFPSAETVTAYCEMLPSTETVNTDFEQWRRTATLLLSLASKVSQYPPEFHFLRLCVDFSRIVLNTSLSSLLYTLNDIGKALSPEYLDHVESFEKITNEIIKPAEEKMKDDQERYEDLQKFSALFYGRCIDTNVDTCSTRPIIEQVLSLERPELVMMMSPVVLRLLMVEETLSPGIFMNLIHQPSAIENCPCLQNIDEVFKDCFSKGLIHHDSYPAVMICDLIQTLLNFDRFGNGDKKDDNAFSFDGVNTSDCEVLMLAKSAIKLISQYNEDERGLPVLSAVAFLRKLFTTLSEFIARNPRAVNVSKNSPHGTLMTEIDSLLKNSKISLQLFFMEQLHKEFSLFDLQKLFAKDDVLPTITKLWRDEGSQSKAVFTSVLKYPEYEEAKLAYSKFLSDDDEQPLKEFLNKCKSSPNHAFALFGTLINMVYLKRAVQTLGDKEEQLVKSIEGNVSSSMFSRELLLKVMGRRDFNCEELQLTHESSVDDVEIALLILHVAWVVSSVQSNSCVLAHDSDEIRSVFEHLPCIKESVCVTCSCGLRLAFKINDLVNECPNCHKDLKREAKSGINSVTQPMNLKSDSNPPWSICTKQMSPAAYRAFHVIVYSSHYARFVVGTSLTESLSTAFQKLLGFDPEHDSKSQLAACLKTLKTDLSCLMEILSCTRTVAIKTMHLVVEETSDLMREKALGANDVSWEDKFSKRTEKVFLMSRNMSKKIKEMIKLKHTKNREGKVTLESRILELDEYPKQEEEQNLEMKRLFRVTKQPCFEDFRSAFLHSPQEIQTKHSFLSLFFAKFEQLLIIEDLNHLLKWSRLVSSALTHRISRKDAQSKSIDDFIREYFPESKQTSMTLLFNSFKEAWNKTRFLVDKELEGKNMPQLQEKDCVAYCLVESDYGIYLKTAIEILISYQNGILDAILSISSHHHPALHALEKRNCSGVACVTIQNVKDEEIISFQWSDDLFKFAKNNPDYGRGQEITYDFETIEMELAAKIALGKCYLICKLNKFIFERELFHTCGPLLTEIRSQVTQSKELPKDVCKGFTIIKERGETKRAQELLQHIEVLIYLLQRKLKDFDAELTLEDFAEEWSTILPSPFPVNLLPEPRRSIKIKHVCALYEALEDVLADGAIEGLAEKFGLKLPNDMKKIIDTMLTKKSDQLKPNNFLRALRRFVFRYLSSETERYWPEESTTLQSCLAEPSLWSPFEPPNLNDIPREITLEYIHSTLKYLEEKLNKVVKNTSTSTKKPEVTVFSRKRQLRFTH